MYLLSKSNRILISSLKYKSIGSYNYECTVKRSENSVQNGIIIDAWKYSFLQQHSRQISHSNSCLFTSIGQQTKYQKLDATKHEKSSSSSIVESKNRANDQISTHVSGVKRGNNHRLFVFNFRFCCCFLCVILEEINNNKHRRFRGKLRFDS